MCHFCGQESSSLLSLPSECPRTAGPTRLHSLRKPRLGHSDDDKHPLVSSLTATDLLFEKPQELNCSPPNLHAEGLTSVPQSVTSLKDRIITEAIKLK